MIAREFLVIVLVFLRSFRRTFAGPFDIPQTEAAGQTGLTDMVFEGVEKWGLDEGMVGGMGRAVSEGDGVRAGEGEDEDAFQCDMYLAQSLVPGLGRGVFAGRDFMRNEMIDRAPSLHVLHDHITNTQVSSHPPPPQLLASLILPPSLALLDYLFVPYISPFFRQRQGTTSLSLLLTIAHLSTLPSSIDPSLPRPPPRHPPPLLPPIFTCSWATTCSRWTLKETVRLRSVISHPPPPSPSILQPFPPSAPQPHRPPSTLLSTTNLT